MAIVFQQPSPVSPPISAAAGAADQFTRFAPVLQRQQEAVAEGYARAAALSQRAASDQADRAQRGSEFAMGLDARRDAEFADAGQRAAEMQFRANLAQQAQQHEAAQTEQRFRLMQEAATAELSQREKVELSRLQMAAGSVRDNPSLDPQEKNDLLTQIYTRIDPLQQRKARAQLQQDQLENQRLQQAIAQQDIIAKDRAAFMAGNLQAVTRDIHDAEGNYVGTFTMIPGEKAHFVDKKAQQAANEEKVQLARQQLEHKHAEAQQKHAERRAEFQAKTYERVAAAFDKQMVDEEKEGKGRPAVKAARSGNIKEEMDEIMAWYDKSNPPPRRPGETPNVGTPPGRPDRKPITADSPPSAAQAEHLAAFDQARGAFAAVPRDGGKAHPEEAEAKAALADAEKLYRKYGDPANMPPDDHAAYLDAVEKARLAAKAFRARTSPPTFTPRRPAASILDGPVYRRPRDI